jgi:hypothetical protein
MLVGWALIGYSLVYPAINMAQHATFSRRLPLASTFGRDSVHRVTRRRLP